MPFARTPQRIDSGLSARCAEARRQVVAFFDWAHFDDARKRSGWETWATRKVHDGWTPELVHDHVKARWLEYRKARSLPPKIEVVDTETFRAKIEAILYGLDHSPEWLPLEPWWERVGQQPPTHDWLAALNRNRGQRGLPTGPPWNSGHEHADSYWELEMPRSSVSR